MRVGTPVIVTVFAGLSVAFALLHGCTSSSPSTDPPGAAAAPTGSATDKNFTIKGKMR